MIFLYRALIGLFNAHIDQSRATARFPDPVLISSIISNASALLDADPPLLTLTGDFIVVGDIHGNLDDLLRIFAREGYPPATSYLFLGDYVNRGSHSIEVVLVLYILKILFPDRLFLLRGNHECDSVSATRGFKGDCVRYLSEPLYREFIDSFLRLPYAAVLNSQVFCVHGGISPLLTSVETIAAIPKPGAAEQGLQKDLLWSDPDARSDGFTHSDRGSGFLFDEECLNNFLDANGLTLLIRSHEPQREGFRKSLQRCLTIFSTTDYQGMGNVGAVVAVSAGGEYDVHTFRAVPKSGRGRRRLAVPDWLLEAVARAGEGATGGEGQGNDVSGPDL
jgi:diadenosine tetraphosphatase ApaH/serine/threonine PP2A family protein phosphatase